MKHMVSKLVCLATVAGISFGAQAYEDEYISFPDEAATAIDLPDARVYVFSNACEAVQVTARKAMTLSEVLLVGGGGGGGGTEGGGGGGGQVLYSDLARGIAAGATFAVTVGAGGASGGTSYGQGGNGGHSILVFPDTSRLTAYGGGAGGGFSTKPPREAAVTGEIGSAGGAGFDSTFKATTPGTYYNYGNPGGAGQGGGGGAGSPGEDKLLHTDADGNPFAGFGGEGLTNDITGVAEVYGSGGGGGGGNSATAADHAPGGTNAGAGAIRTDKGASPRDATSAREGFGGGGGGGGFSNSGGSAGNDRSASAGACGTVILRFSKSADPSRFFEFRPIADQYYTGKPVCPAVKVVVVVSGEELVENQDYTLAYSGNVVPGRAEVVATGINDYSGLEARSQFTILHRWTDGVVDTDDITATVRKEADHNVYTFTNRASAADVNVLAVSTVNRFLYRGEELVGATASEVVAAGESVTVDVAASGADRVELVVLPGDRSDDLMAIAPIEARGLDGNPACPELTVTARGGATVLTADEDYAATYINNTLPGTATVIVTGADETAYAGIVAVAEFTVLDAFEDDNIVASYGDVRCVVLGDRFVYIVTNARECVFQPKRNLTLKDALVVGGGGAGGNVVGGGGGGGGVTTQANERVVFAGRDLTIKVGAGGLIGGAANSQVTGLQGGTSTLTFADGSSLVAYGGGGGGGYTKSPSSAASDGIASGGGGGGGGAYSGGNDGFNYDSRYGKIGGTASNNLGGGGGGAAKAGSGGKGGEGLTNAITGVEVVYGSGGGGGARDSGRPGTGGTNAGDGTNGQSRVRAYFGKKGTGAGGGGGGYVNAGGYNYGGGDGGSGTVILSFVPGGEAGQPTITAKAITYPDGITQPKVSVTLGNATSSPFNAKVTVKFYTTPGEILDTLEFGGVVAGETREDFGKFCVDAGVEVFADVIVESDGATDVNETASEVATGKKPDCYGHGGGAHVIHVRPGAAGRGNGTSWFDAYTDFREALKELSTDRPEIWFAGDETTAVTKSELNPDMEVWIRGGFTGLEDKLGDRAKGAKSLIDSVSVGNCFDFANANAVTLDGFELRHGQSHNLIKSGAGDLTVTNCVFSNTSAAGNGRGLYVSGGTAATIRIVDVRFTNLFGGGTQGANNGTAAYFSSVARVFIDDCAFTTNGCSFGNGYNNSMYQQNGAAIYASGAPLTVRNTRFTGNRSQALQGGGGVIRIGGNCGATAFTNCTFVGNETIHGYGNYTQFTSPTTGMFVFSPSAGTLDLVNCTFAHGVAEVSEGAAGVSVRSGTANIRNCIFYGNTNGVTNTAGFDVDVVSGATANIAYSLFEDTAPRRISCAEGGTTNCTGLVYGNPLFVTDAAPGKYLEISGTWMKLKSSALNELCTCNVHLRGGSGYYDESTGEKVTAYRRKGNSPALNAGDPASDYSGEPTPNGRRVNLGVYGNTPWATMSPGGTMIFVK